VSEVQRRWVLSGGIGSGKSTVRRLLEKSGIATIDADGIGHLVLEPDGPASAEVASRWPWVVVDEEIDRAALASIVFEDPGELASLESITHPYIFDTIRAWVQDIAGPVVVEIPLFYHRLGDDWRRIVVDCDDQTRLHRLLDRGMTEDDIRARMKTQPSRADWLAAADLVIPNHGSLNGLVGTVALVASRL
jgi:dephospho-CoA kinase